MKIYVHIVFHLYMSCKERTYTDLSFLWSLPECFGSPLPAIFWCGMPRSTLPKKWRWFSHNSEIVMLRLWNFSPYLCWKTREWEHQSWQITTPPSANNQNDQNKLRFAETVKNTLPTNLPSGVSHIKWWINQDQTMETSSQLAGTTCTLPGRRFQRSLRPRPSSASCMHPGDWLDITPSAKIPIFMYVYVCIDR